MLLAEINVADIIKRGYVREEEYEALSTKMEKLQLSNDDGGETEGIWIAPLENSGEAGTRFHFVYFNDPLHFMGGPRPIAGMVGIGISRGRFTRATAIASESQALFEKAGAPAIEYFHACAKKHEKEKKPDGNA